MRKPKAPNIPPEEETHSHAFMGVDTNDGGSTAIAEIIFKDHVLVPTKYLASLKRALAKAGTQRTLQLAEQSESLYVQLKVMTDLLEDVTGGSFAVGSPDWIAMANLELERADEVLKTTVAIAGGK